MVITRVRTIAQKFDSPMCRLIRWLCDSFYRALSSSNVRSEVHSTTSPAENNVQYKHLFTVLAFKRLRLNILIVLLFYCLASVVNTEWWLLVRVMWNLTLLQPRSASPSPVPSTNEHVYSPTRHKDRQRDRYIQWKLQATISHKRMTRNSAWQSR